jgi:beta-glucanase (GH16 family)
VGVFGIDAQGQMPRLPRLLPAFAVAATVLAVAQPADARGTRTLTQRVASAGTYDVTLTVRAPRAVKRVTATVEGTRKRIALRKGRAMRTLRVAITDGALNVRVTGGATKLKASTQAQQVAAAADVRRKPVKPAPAPTPAPSPTPVPTNLVWSDEFNSAAGTLPDGAKWEPQTGDGWGNGAEWQTYTDKAKNASADGAGNLAITALKEPGVGAHGYTSARLETRGLYSFTYGRLEARMKIPAGMGLWPAFWAMGDDVTTVGWPNAGEIDVMEALGHEPNTAYAHIHGPVGTTQTEYQWGKAVTAPTSLADGFHTYGVIWSPGQIQWTLDGTVYATVKSTDLQSGQRWVYDHPFHILLDLAVGGAWPGYPDASTPFPAKLLVDYVRVYQ